MGARLPILVAATALGAVAYVLWEARHPARPDGGAVADFTRAHRKVAPRLI